MAGKADHRIRADVGLADTNALNVAVNVFNATELVGMPECSVFLAEAVIYKWILQ